METGRGREMEGQGERKEEREVANDFLAEQRDVKDRLAWDSVASKLMSNTAPDEKEGKEGRGGGGTRGKEGSWSCQDEMMTEIEWRAGEGDEEWWRENNIEKMKWEVPLWQSERKEEGRRKSEMKNDLSQQDFLI